MTAPNDRATAVAWEFARQYLTLYLGVREPSLSAEICEAHIHASESRVSVMVRKPLTDADTAAHRSLAVALATFGFVRIEERVTRHEDAPDPFERWDWPGPNWRGSNLTAAD